MESTPVRDGVELHRTGMDQAGRGTSGSTALRDSSSSRTRYEWVISYLKALFVHLRPFFHWLHYVWLDIAMIILGLLVALILRQDARIFNYENRRFPIIRNAAGSWDPVVGIGWPRYLTPAHEAMKGVAGKPETPDFLIGIFMIGAAVAGVASAIFILMQLFVRDMWDKTAATIGMHKALVTV